jgi:hypothetical protein
MVRSLLSGILVLGLVACQSSGEAAEAAARTAKARADAATLTLDAGRQFSIATTRPVSSRTAKRGDVLTATVVEDVQDDAGRVTIPAGSIVSGTITDVESAPSPSWPGTLTLAVNGVTVRGTSYPIHASIDSLATERSGRPISGGDAVRVGVGAAAGAIAGQIIAKGTKGTVIGAVVGAAPGAAYAAASKDGNLRLPARTNLIVTLTQRLAITGS